MQKSPRSSALSVSFELRLTKDGTSLFAAAAAASIDTNSDKFNEDEDDDRAAVLLLLLQKPTFKIFLNSYLNKKKI
jgi:hypothetical protein